MASLSHEERTSADTRATDLHLVKIVSIDELSDARIRVLRLQKQNRDRTINFLPGQWLDVFVPDVSQAGGFTITSTPKDEEGPSGLIEIAVQAAPQNRVAAWLWKPLSSLLEESLSLRVGGSFVWPPPNTDPASIQRLILVAGGVGINPLISIMSHLCQQCIFPSNVVLLYASKAGANRVKTVLFLQRIIDIVRACEDTQFVFHLYLTSILSDVTPDDSSNSVTYGAGDQHLATNPELHLLSSGKRDIIDEGSTISEYSRRMNSSDLIAAIGPGEEGSKVVAYVCGPPILTDWAVKVLQQADGIDPTKVFHEKWW